MKPFRDFVRHNIIIINQEPVRPYDGWESIWLIGKKQGNVEACEENCKFVQKT